MRQAIIELNQNEPTAADGGEDAAEGGEEEAMEEDADVAT